MHVYVCMYVCKYVSMYVYMHALIHACVSATYVKMCTYVDLHSTYLSVYVRIHACLCMHSYVCVRSAKYKNIKGKAFPDSKLFRSSTYFKQEIRNR
jgi:hypothetical protein